MEYSIHAESILAHKSCLYVVYIQKGGKLKKVNAYWHRGSNVMDLHSLPSDRLGSEGTVADPVPPSH